MLDFGSDFGYLSNAPISLCVKFAFLVCHHKDRRKMYQYVIQVENFLPKLERIATNIYNYICHPDKSGRNFYYCGEVRCLPRPHIFSPYIYKV